MTKRFTFEILDADDGILRDGETRTHRMMMRDSITKTPIEIALDATHAVKVRDAAILDAASRPGFRHTAPLITDAHRARAAQRDKMYEASDREVSDAWRRKDTVIADTDTRQAWHDARNAELTKRADVSRTEHFDAATAQGLKDAAYAAVDADLTEAWRKTASQF
jgi:hypothetical protein